MNAIQIKITTLSQLWTGKEPKNGSEFILTGFIGSLRWWLEAVVRGLGYRVCDPTEPTKGCSFDVSAYQNKLKKMEVINPQGLEEGALKEAVQEGIRDICPVCRLFGCRGYKGSLQFSYKKNPRLKTSSITGIESGQEIFVKIKPVRKITAEEWWLLSQTLRLITEYGSIGGKTVHKTQDFGIVSMELVIPKDLLDVTCKKGYNANARRIENSDLPNLKYFWFVKNCPSISKNKINRLLGLKQSGDVDPTIEVKNRYFYQFIRGSQNSSKKIFSFIGQDYRRLWGYVRNPNELTIMKNNLIEVLKIKEEDFITGEQVLEKWEVM